MKLFVFVLLATLLIVNADNAQLHKRETEFGPCPLDPGTVTQLTVKLLPDPIALGKSLDVTISGKLLVDVPAGETDKVVQVAFLDSSSIAIGDPFSVNFCDSKGIECPVPKGTEFSTVMTVQVPPELAKGDTIVADVATPDHEEFYACAVSNPVS